MNIYPNFNDFDKFFIYGRFAILKFKSEKDALKLYLEKNRINVPLITGKKGMPFMCPGELLKRYIEETK